MLISDAEYMGVAAHKNNDDDDFPYILREWTHLLHYYILAELTVSTPFLSTDFDLKTQSTAHLAS